MGHLADQVRRKLETLMDPSSLVPSGLDGPSINVPANIGPIQEVNPPGETGGLANIMSAVSTVWPLIEAMVEGVRSEELGGLSPRTRQMEREARRSSLKNPAMYDEGVDDDDEDYYESLRDLANWRSFAEQNAPGRMDDWLTSPRTPEQRSEFLQEMNEARHRGGANWGLPTEMTPTTNASLFKLMAERPLTRSQMNSESVDDEPFDEIAAQEERNRAYDAGEVAEALPERRQYRARRDEHEKYFDRIEERRGRYARDNEQNLTSRRRSMKDAVAQGGGENIINRTSERDRIAGESDEEYESRLRKLDKATKKAVTPGSRNQPTKVINTGTMPVNRRTEAYDEYVGRGSKFGNPFPIGKHMSREQSIAKYKDWLLNGKGPDSITYNGKKYSRSEVLASVKNLKGKKLGCYCKPDACHADVLADLADGKISVGGKQPETAPKTQPAQSNTLDQIRQRAEERRRSR